LANNTAQSLDLVSLDYDTIKASLKSYLAAQPEFQAYDFDQGGLAAVVKLLAYSSWNNAFLLNMVASESFLDTAQLMPSVASHAKELGYVPGSAKSGSARVQMTWTGTSPVYYVQKGNEFAGLIRGAGAVTFTASETTAVAGVNGSFSVTLDVYEGPYVSDTWVINASAGDRYVLTNPNVDTDSMSVVVYEGSSTTPTTYARSSSLLGLTSTSRVWFLQMAESGAYEVLLGDGVSGYVPPSGSRMVVEYRSTKGSDGNGATKLTASFVPYPGDAVDVVTEMIAVSAGGADAETLDSVRFRAPRHFQVQERGVNENDYAILLREQFPEVADAIAYGGEKASPPRYGRVYIAVDLSDASAVSDSRRESYEAFLRPRSTLTTIPVVVNPERSWISATSMVRYDQSLEVTTPAVVRASVLSAIGSWAETNLGGFNSSLRLSRLSAAVDGAVSVLSNDTTYSVYKVTTPTRGSANKIRVSMGFPVAVTPTDPSSAATRRATAYTVWTAPFVLTGANVFVADDGLGVMRLVQGGVFRSAVGSVDYDTGDISFTTLTIDDYTGTGLRVYARSRDPDVTAPSGTVLALGDEVSVTVTSV